MSKLSEDEVVIEPWELEPNYLKWIDRDTGYHCVIVRVAQMGHLCGYVKVPQRHPFYRRYYAGRVERKLNVHGGITFSGRPCRYTGGRLRGHWFGFDCAHYSDIVPAFTHLPGLRYRDGGVYRDVDYVKEQCRLLAKQLKRIGKC